MTKNNDDDACQASKDNICYNSKHAKESITNVVAALFFSSTHVVNLLLYFCCPPTN
jgi:hypothetical protein